MSQYLYGRKVKIYIADKEGKAWEVAGLRCTFQVEKIALKQANYAEITVYNLTQETEENILKEGAKVMIEAGYDGFINTADGQTQVKQYGILFVGDIVQIIRDREDNVDQLLTLVCLDGDSFLNNSILQGTVNAGMNQRQFVEFIAHNSLTSLGKVSTKLATTEIGRITPELSTKALPRGKVFFGMPKQYLGDIARDNAATFWVDEGKIYIAKATDIPYGEALVLTPQTGLIGTPRQIQGGITFRCLLHPGIRLMTMIKIDNSYIRQQKYRVGLLMSKLDEDGLYQAYRVRHIGDTRGDEWYTEVDGMGKIGNIPSMLADAMQDPT